jgi:hypothetical protein
MLAPRHRATARLPGVRRRLVRARREAPDRRGLRLVAAVLCLGLALYCLIAATATLHAQATVPGEASATKPSDPERQRLPLLTPLLFLVFGVILAATLRRGRRGAGPLEVRQATATAGTVRRQDTVSRR